MNRTSFRYIYNIVLCSCLMVLISCGGGSTNEVQQPPGENPGTTFPAGAEVPDNRYVDHYRILLFGNSHVYVNNLGGVIAQLIQSGRPGVAAEAAVTSNSAFLDERLEDGSSLLKLNSEPWTHVILQGQKYSMSGSVDYPLDASIYWIQASKHHNATPLMFPEHPREGQPEEGSRIHSIHTTIANREKTCVAPVGLAFDSLRELAPEIRLHQQDGNHASVNGTFLTALVFYQAITGLSADSLPDVPGIDISIQLQQLMRQVASATLAEHPACHF